MLTRPADQFFKFTPKYSRVRWFHTPLGVKGLEHGKPDDLLHLEVVLRLCATRHESPSILPALLVQHVVPCPLFRISQHRIGLKERTESVLVAGLLIIGMESLRQQPVDAVDRLWVGARVDLQHFVIIDGFFYRHKRGFITVA